jgi:hypothetical protein
MRLPSRSARRGSITRASFDEPVYNFAMAIMGYCRRKAN